MGSTGNPRKTSIFFDKDRRQAGREIEQIHQQDHTNMLLGQILAALHENNRLLATLVHAQTGRMPVPPPLPPHPGPPSR